MSVSYTGKTVIVTGGASGLGLAIVKAFHAEGANVIATDINDKALNALHSSAGVPADDSRLVPYNCDSADEAKVQKLIADATTMFGRLDVLVNNAGVNDNLDPAGDCSMAMWERNIRVNVTGPFITTKYAVKQFVKQDLVNGSRGVILNVISAAGSNGARAG
jgi:NAD(P)-dependent dehydrogenase (short-subunit alcohol dehydrogenase family)